jgi:hypothetical protein
MRFALLIVAVVGFSTTAFAQGLAPTIGNKPLVQVKPKVPAGCKLVGTVKGTKLWAGDCVASEPGDATSNEIQPLSEGALGALRPAEKQ